MATYTLSTVTRSFYNTLGAVSGDTILIPTGSYPGFDATQISGVTFVASGGVVTFTSNLLMGKSFNVVWDGSQVPGQLYGFKYTGTNDQVFDLGDGYKGMKAFGWDFGGGSLYVLDARTKIEVPPFSGNILTYNGDPSTLAMANVTLDTFKITGKTSVFAGTFDAPSTYRMVTSGITMDNAVINFDGTSSCVMVTGNSMYGFSATNWVISGDTNDTLDVGVFYLNSGNIKLNRIVRWGGWGYIARIFHLALNSSQRTQITNTIKYGSVRYGAYDIRINDYDTDPLNAIPRIGTDIDVINNNSGDLTDNGTYVVPLVVLGNINDSTGHAFTLNLENNFCYNARQNAGSNNTSLIKTNYDAGKAVVNYQNNVDIVGALPAGYIADNISFLPIPGSPLVGTGIATFVTKDFNGSLRQSPPDIGAVQHANFPPTASVSGSTITLPISQVTITGSASDSDGYVIFNQWSQISGPNVPAIVTPNAYTTNITGLIEGTYIFRLTVADNFGGTGSADATITVNPAPPTVITSFNNQNATLNNMVDIFHSIARGHEQIHSFGFGEEYDINAVTVTNYPLLWVWVLPANINDGWITYNFRVIMLDIVDADQRNETEVLSDTIQVLRDIFYILKDYYGFDVKMGFPVNPFTEKQSDRLSGWYADASIDVIQSYGECDAPFLKCLP